MVAGTERIFMRTLNEQRIYICRAAPPERERERTIGLSFDERSKNPPSPFARLLFVSFLEEEYTKSLNHPHCTHRAEPVSLNVQVALNAQLPLLRRLKYSFNYSRIMPRVLKTGAPRLFKSCHLSDASVAIENVFIAEYRGEIYLLRFLLLLLLCVSLPRPSR